MSITPKQRIILLAEVNFTNFELMKNGKNCEMVKCFRHAFCNA